MSVYVLIWHECAAAAIQSVGVNVPKPWCKLSLCNCPTWTGGRFSYWLHCCLTTDTDTVTVTVVGMCTRTHTGGKGWRQEKIGKTHVQDADASTEVSSETQRWRRKKKKVVTDADIGWSCVNLVLAAEHSRWRVTTQTRKVNNGVRSLGKPTIWLRLLALLN